MKHNTFLVISIAVGIAFTQILSFLGLSYWLILVLIPVFGYVQLYLSSQYNFRDSLALLPIPEQGYESRLHDLEANRRLLESLGFVKFDEFYMQLTSDAITYAYRHDQYPIEVCDYHFGQAHCCDLISKFENGFTLTTTNSQNAGKFPQPPENLLQAFPLQNAGELLSRHLRAGKFLTERGFQVKTPGREFFRERFLADFMRSKKLFTGWLSPVRSVYWVTVKKENKYLKGIEEQFLARSLPLP